MNKMKRIFVLLMAALAIMTSCKKTVEPAPSPEPDAIPLQIATSVTRATEYAFEANDVVGILMDFPRELERSCEEHHFESAV